MDKVSRIERICDHAMHLIDRGGIECVGLGTDFDGISGEFEISDCTKLPLLFDALRKRGLSEDAVEQIAYQNIGARDPGRHEIEKSCTWKISPVAVGNHLAGKENIVYTFWWLHYSKKRN